MGALIIPQAASAIVLKVGETPLTKGSQVEAVTEPLVGEGGGYNVTCHTYTLSGSITKLSKKSATLSFTAGTGEECLANGGDLRKLADQRDPARDAVEPQIVLTRYGDDERRQAGNHRIGRLRLRIQEAHGHLRNGRGTGGGEPARPGGEWPRVEWRRLSALATTSAAYALYSAGAAVKVEP